MLRHRRRLSASRRRCAVFLTPVYFVASIWASARHSVVKVAFVIGVIAGPAFAVIAPEFDILYAGIGGGTAAYLIDRLVFRFYA